MPAKGYPDVQLEFINSSERSYACALAPDLEPGPVKEWRLDAARPHPGVRDVVVLREEVIPPPEHCASRALFVIAVGRTWFGAVRRAVEAGRKVEVVYASSVGVDGRTPP